MPRTVRFHAGCAQSGVSSARDPGAPFKDGAESADGREPAHTLSGEHHDPMVETGFVWGRRTRTTCCRPLTRPATPECVGEIQEMLMWPAVTLFGFLLLMAMVIALGAQTTARYEREQRDGNPVPKANGAAEPVGALAA
jgi:hypothetical protein